MKKLIIACAAVLVLGLGLTTVGHVLGGQFYSVYYNGALHPFSDAAQNFSDKFVNINDHLVTADDDDDSDFDPIHPATEEQLKILEFFDSAELFEIQYLAQFCERFECSPIIAIDYINVYRKHADYAIDEVIEDLASLGYKCDKAAFQIYYTEYFNYRDETSWSQIMSIGYKS